MTALKIEDLRNLEANDYTEETVWQVLGACHWKALKLSVETSNRAKVEALPLKKMLENISGGYKTATYEEIIPLVEKCKYQIKVLGQQCSEAVKYFTHALDWMYQHKEDTVSSSANACYFVGGQTILF